MAKDKDGRPILAADDWKTGKDRKEEASEAGRGKIIRIVLALGLLLIAGWIFITANMTDEVNVATIWLIVVAILILGWSSNGSRGGSGSSGGGCGSSSGGGGDGGCGGGCGGCGGG